MRFAPGYPKKLFAIRGENAIMKHRKKKRRQRVKLISWNVNGIRACLTKGFEESFRKLDADIFCIQETNARKAR